MKAVVIGSRFGIVAETGKETAELANLLATSLVPSGRIGKPATYHRNCPVKGCVARPKGKKGMAVHMRIHKK